MHHALRTLSNRCHAHCGGLRVAGWALVGNGIAVTASSPLGMRKGFTAAL